MLFLLYICFGKKLKETSHHVFIKVLVVNIWFLLLCDQDALKPELCFFMFMEVSANGVMLIMLSTQSPI